MLNNDSNACMFLAFNIPLPSPLLVVLLLLLWWWWWLAGKAKRHNEEIKVSRICTNSMIPHVLVMVW